MHCGNTAHKCNGNGKCGEIRWEFFCPFYLSWENSNHKKIQQGSGENMNKFSNKRQIHILFAKMQRNPDMAKGRSKGNKKKFDVFWDKLSMELNNAGPPIKSMYEWKKVWIDQKRYVKKKAANAMAAMQAAGGAPSGARPFPSVTETILHIADIVRPTRASRRAAINVSQQVSALEAIGMEESQIVMRRNQTLEHAAAETREESATSNGAPPMLLPSTESEPCATEVLTPYSIIVKEEPFLGAHANEEVGVSSLLIPKVETEECAPEIFNEECHLHVQSARKDKDSAVWEPETVIDLGSDKRARNEIENASVGVPLQKEIYQKINEAIDNANRHNRELKVGMKKIQQKLCRLEEQNKLKLDEFKRHNREMERLQRQKVESEIKKNARILEIEELKLKIMELRDKQRDIINIV